VTLQGRPPWTPTSSSPDIAGIRLPGIRLSDRLLQCARRFVAARPCFTGSVAVHALLAMALLSMAGLGARQATRRIPLRTRAAR
jgi:hypothetical protein